MSAERFSVGTQFQWADETYEVRRLLADSTLSLVNVRTNEPQTVPYVALLKAVLADELCFLVDGRPVKPSYGNGYVDLADCPELLRAVAEYREEVIRPLLNLPRDERAAAVTARVAEYQKKHEGHPRSLLTTISEPSVYRWMRASKKGGGDRRALVADIEKRGGKQGTRLGEVDKIIAAVIEDNRGREKRTLDYLHREIALRIQEENRQRPPSEQLKKPGRTTVARRVAALDVEEQLIARRGRREARRELTQYGSMEYPSLPLERVEIDHTKLDLVVVDEDDLLPLGRLTFTFCLDTATRYPLGYYLGFEPPSYYTVMECLHHAICPKEDVRGRFGTAHDWIAHGTPYLLVVDNGKEFTGRDLADACDLLGINLLRAPVGDPQFKAAIERLFGTVNTGLLHTVPGTTFSNILQRGDYDSMKQACVFLSDLETILHTFLLDIYAEDFHRGLNGIPARRWEDALRSGFFPRVPHSGEELRILLGRVEYRTVQPYGIELYSLRYNCDELALVRTRAKESGSREFKIKYDPGDLSRVYLYDPADRRYIEVPALAQEYTRGLSLWKHQVIRNFVLAQQDRVDIEALGQAQRRIQEIVEKGLQRKKLSTRSRIGRWQRSGRKPALPEQPKPAELPGPTPLPALPGPGLDFDVEVVEGEAAPLPSPAACRLDFDLEEEEPAAAEVAPPVPAVELDLDLEELAAEGWRVSHDLPGARKEK